MLHNPCNSEVLIGGIWVKYQPQHAECSHARSLARGVLLPAGVDDRASRECTGPPGEQSLQVLTPGKPKQKVCRISPKIIHASPNTGLCISSSTPSSTIRCRAPPQSTGATKKTPVWVSKVSVLAFNVRNWVPCACSAFKIHRDRSHRVD